jgi:hypothetical protein
MTIALPLTVRYRAGTLGHSYHGLMRCSQTSTADLSPVSPYFALTGRLIGEDSVGSDRVVTQLPTSVMHSRLLTAPFYCTGNMTCS